MEDHNYDDTNMDDESSQHDILSSVGNDGLIDLAPNVSAEQKIDLEHAIIKTVILPASVNVEVDVSERDELYVADSADLPSAIHTESLGENKISEVSSDSLGINQAKHTPQAFDPSGVTPMDQDQDVMVNDSNDLGDAFVAYSDCVATGEDIVEVECSTTADLIEARRDDISSIPVSGSQGNIPNESDCSMDQVQDSNLATINGPCEVARATGTESLSPASAGIMIESNVSPKPNMLPISDSALGLLSNYGNDSCDSDDNDDEVKVEPSIVNVAPPNVIQLPTKPDEYRTIQPSSDDSESDSSESSEEESTSGSSSESLDDRISSGKSNKPPEPEVDIYEEGESAEKPVVLRTKGETSLDELPPIADLQISVPEEAVIEMGIISSIVEQQVVVQAKQNFPPMNLDTVLFLEKGKRPLGVIFDVFGQVTEPFYSVRFNSTDHVKEKRIEAGMAVYCAPHTEHTNYVFMDELLKMKGTDASWQHNNETPSTFLDFSDDETELQALRQEAKGSRSMNQSTATDCGQPQRKRVNSFERRMNERNLQKSALPPEPRQVLPAPVRASNTPRAKRTKPANPFTAQPRAGRGGPSPGPVFPPPIGAQPVGLQPRPPQHGWEWVDNSSMDQSMVYGSPLSSTFGGAGRSRCRPSNFGGRGRALGFAPVPTQSMPFGRGQGLPQHENPPHLRYGGPHPAGQPGGSLTLAYSMGHHMPPNANNQSMVYPTGMMRGAHRPMFPVLLRPATFQGGPPRYDANSFVQNMPFGSPPQAYPQCFSSGPPQPPARGQSYSPMFSGVPMYNPGFPPPQLPPRAAMYPIGPPPPPRGGV